MIIFNNSIPIVIAAANMNYYRNYFIACEYLQIDPKKEHEFDYINNRIEHVLSFWTEVDEGYKKLTKELKMFKRNYKTYVGKLYKIPKRLSKAIAKERFKIDEQTISETYVKKPLTKINYKAYSRYSNMLALKTLGILLIVVLGIITVLMSRS